MNLQVLNKISYGMYVVCSRKGDKINGQIVNTVFQITSEPPFCITVLFIMFPI